MLKLFRVPGESIHIANNIVVKVLNIQDMKVCIGIEAPVDFRVLRNELLNTYGPLKDAYIKDGVGVGNEIHEVSNE